MYRTSIYLTIHELAVTIIISNSNINSIRLPTLVWLLLLLLDYQLLALKFGLLEVLPGGQSKALSQDPEHSLVPSPSSDP